jgi:hypothetical protein
MNASSPVTHQDMDEYSDIELSELIDLYPTKERPPTPHPYQLELNSTRSWTPTMRQFLPHQRAMRRSYRRSYGRVRWAHIPRLMFTSKLLPIAEVGDNASLDSILFDDSI